MLKTIIIEDEQHCIDRLKRMLEEQFPNINLAGCFLSVKDGLDGIKKISPDIVFLDVQLHDKTGFDLLHQMQQVNFSVIFTTAYEEYALQAFRFNAIDYLLKPVEESEFANAVNRALETRSDKENASRIKMLLHNLQHAENGNKRICIPTMNGLEFLHVSEIIRCESDINYTTIFIKQQQKLVVAKTLKEFEALLRDYNFFRVHNSHLINLNCIKSYNKGKGGYITMNDGSMIEVSIRRKEEFLKRVSEM